MTILGKNRVVHSRKCCEGARDDQNRLVVDFVTILGHVCTTQSLGVWQEEELVQTLHDGHLEHEHTRVVNPLTEWRLVWRKKKRPDSLHWQDHDLQTTSCNARHRPTRKCHPSCPPWWACCLFKKKPTFSWYVELKSVLSSGHEIWHALMSWLFQRTECDQKFLLSTVTNERKRQTFLRRRESFPGSCIGFSVDSAVHKRAQRLNVVTFRVVQREEFTEDVRVHRLHADRLGSPGGSEKKWANESKWSTIRWSNLDRRDPKMGVFLPRTETTPCGHLLKWKLTPQKPPVDTIFMAAMAMFLLWKIVDDLQSFQKKKYETLTFTLKICILQEHGFKELTLVFFESVF